MSLSATESHYPPLALIPADRFVYRCGKGEAARSTLALESEAPFPSDQLALATREEGAEHIAAAGWLKRCTPQGNSLLVIPEPLVPMPLKPDWSGGVSIRMPNGSFSAKKAQGTTIPSEVTLEDSGTNPNNSTTAKLTSASVDGKGMAVFEWEWDQGKETVRLPVEDLASCDPRTRSDDRTRKGFRNLSMMRKASGLLPYAAAGMIGLGVFDLFLALSNTSKANQLEAGEPAALKAQKQLERSRLLSSLTGQGVFVHLSALNATRPEGLTWQSFSDDGTRIVVRGSAADGADVDRFRGAAIGSGWFGSANITRASIGPGGGSFEMTADPVPGLGPKSP